MFVSDKSDTNRVSKRGNAASIEDVTKERQQKAAIYGLAEENARNIFQALFPPFVDYLDETYEIEVN